MAKTKRCETPGKLRQVVAAFVANLAGMSYGTVIGWQSPVLPQLQSENSPLGSGPMTDEAASWLNGILCLSGTFVTLLIGFGADQFSRKFTCCATALPLCISWLLMVFGTEQVHLFISRFFAGIGGAIALFIVPLYVSEISSDEIRGMLGSLLVLLLNTGILFGYILGALLSIRVFAVVALVLPLLYLALFIFMPESPVYLIRRNRLHDAARSLLWLRAGHRPTVEQDITRIEAELRETSCGEAMRIRDLFRDQATIKGLIISLGLFGGQQFCGIFAMISYTESIFRISGSSLSPNMSAIVIGAIQVVGSYLSTSLMERAGRRLLILISCFGMCFCHYVLGTFCFLQNQSYDLTDLGWLPIVALSVYVIFYCLGMGPGPYVVTSEVFARDITGTGTMIGLFFVWLMAFVVGKFFPTMVALLGMDGCFFLLGTFCAGSFIFALLLVPETKGRPRQDIVNQLNGTSRDFTDKIYCSAKQPISKNSQSTEQI